MNKIKISSFFVFFFLKIVSAQSVDTSLLEKINIKDLSFDKHRVKLRMKLNDLKVSYPNIKFKAVNTIEEDETITEDRDYFLKNNYVVEGEINNSVTVYQICIVDSGTYLDNCKVTVGDDYSKLKSCYPNMYRLILKEYEQMKQEDRVKYQKQYGTVIFQIPIIYEGSKDVPLGLIFSLNVATGKIEKIYTHSQ